MIKKNYQPRPLDEVTDLLSSIYYNDQKKAIKDAVFYLKEYKDKIYTFAYQDAEMRQYLKEKNNPPLTWQELQQMEGKPVWIEADNGQEKFKHWFIIDEFTFSDIPGLQIMWCLNNSFRFLEANIGKTWQAYRKEKK